MLRAFFIILATALSLLVVDLAVPGVNIANFPSAMIAAVVIGAINSSIRPILSTLAMPINILSLGAASLLVNGICFWLAAVLVPGFGVHGLLAIILGPVALSFVNTLLNRYIAERRPELGMKSELDIKPQP